MEDKTKVKEEIGGYLSGLLGSIKGAIESIGSLTGNVKDTVASKKPSTYEEWLNTRVDTLKADKESQIGYLDEYQKSQEAALAQQKDLAVQGAQTERQRAYTDANTAYRQGLSQYGINAERLASMGLRGSGYSDYLAASAYSTERAEKAAANAQERATVANAENVYYTGKQTLADSVMREKNAINSTYSQMIDQAYGDSLKYAEEKKTASTTEQMNSIAASGDNIGAIITGTENGVIDKTAAKNDILTLLKVDKNNLPGFDFKGLAEAKDKGIIDDPEYDSIVSDYQSEFSPSYAFISGDEELDFDQAKEALAKYEEYASIIGEDTIAAIRDEYNKKYAITTRDGLTSDIDSISVKDGKNFTIKYPKKVYHQGKEYDLTGQARVQVAVVDNDDPMIIDLKREVESLGENNFFLFRGKIYFVNGDTVYSIEGRPLDGANGDEYVKSVYDYLTSGGN